MSVSTFTTTFSLAIGDMNSDEALDFAFGNSTLDVDGDNVISDGDVSVIFGTSSYPSTVSVSANIDRVRSFFASRACHKSHIDA